MAMSDRYKFTVSFKQIENDEGSIDVKNLAPSMLSLSKLFEDANSLLNENKASTNLKAVATNFGSFEISFIIDQSTIQAATELFNTDFVTAKALVAHLFFDNEARVSLSTLLKFLEGKIPDEINILGNQVNFIIGSKNKIVNKQVYNLYKDPKSRKSFEKFVQPLASKELNSIEVFEEDKRQELNKKDLESYNADIMNEEIISDNEIELILRIVSLSDPEDYMWRLNDGDKTSYYSVKDAEFIEKIKKGKKFSLNDNLRCLVRFLQKRDKVNNKIKTEREILKVLDHLEYKEEQIDFGYE